MSQDFVHLHVHSEFSLLDGLSKIKKLIERTKEYGQKAIGLTDHGSMYGAINFYKAALKEEIKPIIGCEAYMASESRFDKKRSDAYHILLLAKDKEGYENLMKLVSISYLDGFYYKPRVDKETLLKYHKGLIATTGCPSSLVNRTMINEGYKQGLKEAKELSQIFGKDNLFIELQRHHMDRFINKDMPEKIKNEITQMQQQNVDLETHLLKLSKELDLPLIATNDVHYVDKEDATAQDAVVCVQTGKLVSDINRMRYIDVPDYYLKSPEEMKSNFSDLPQAISNTGKIADRINLEITIGQWFFPKYELPEGKTAGQALKELAYSGAKELFKEVAGEVKKRLDYELEIIETKGYSPYFLIFSDLAKASAKMGIYVNTRGSAAGSLVSYCCGITTVDPLRFNLPFERFLNPLRPSAPDIDFDVSDDKRDLIIDYLKEKYGTDKVAQICTFGTMKAKAAIRDIGRVLGYPYSDVDKISKMIPEGKQGFPMNLTRALQITPELKEAYDKDETTKKIIDLSKAVEGNVRHISVHAAGVVISPKDMNKFSPTQLETSTKKGETPKVITQYEMHACEDVGLVKLDILGIRNLSILANAVEIINKNRKTPLDIKKIPLDDPNTFKLFSEGETFGVFQFASSGMTKHLLELKPEQIEDIMAMVALYRPGPMSSIPEYIKRKHNPSLITYLDPRMEKFLKKSKGILVYQDDVLYCAMELSGYDWGEVDKFRKAIGKKIPEEMEKQKDRFINGCIERGMKKETAQELFEQIETFAAYGFNKCVIGSTSIIVNNQPTTVEKLYKQSIKNKKILSLNNKGHIENAIIKNIIKNESQQVYQLTTRSGHQITASGNHPFLTFNGWKNLDKLQTKERIALANQIPPVKKDSLKPYQAAILGYLISEGNLCHPHGIYFYNSDQEIIDDYSNHLKQFTNIIPQFNDSKKAISVYSKNIDQKLPDPLFQLVKTLGLHNKTATHKFIPPQIFDNTNQTIAIFLAKLFQGDGCFDTKSLLFYYATSSHQLATDLQTLLLRFNIISQKYTKKFKYQGAYKIGWTVNISHQDNLSKLYLAISKHLIGKKRQQLDQIVNHSQLRHDNQPNKIKISSLNTLPAEILSLIRQEMAKKELTIKSLCQQLNISSRNLYIDKSKRGYTKNLIKVINSKLNSEQLDHHLNTQIFWDEVKEIKKLGKQETYDLTVEPNHNFIANDFIVHNSHAASYGMVAYWTAFTKANYPVEYMTSLMTAEANNTDKLTEAISATEKLGIRILPPDINESETNFTIVDLPKEQWLTRGRAKDTGKAIRFGFSAIKNVGAAAIEAIVTGRKEGPFTSLTDFIFRVNASKVNKKVIESLIYSGTLDRFGKRAALLAILPELKDKANKAAKDKATGQEGLFTSYDQKNNDKHQDKLPDIEEFPLVEKLKFEKKLLGFYLTDNPIKQIVAQIEHKVSHKIEDINPNLHIGQIVTLGGILNSIRIVNTKKNNSEMAFASLEDTTGSIDLVIFPKIYQEAKDIITIDKGVLVTGRVDNKDNQLSILVETISEIKKEHTDPKNNRDLEIPRGTPKENLIKINSLLKQNSPGKHTVTIVIKNGGPPKLIDLPYTVNLTETLEKKIKALL